MTSPEDVSINDDNDTHLRTRQRRSCARQVTADARSPGTEVPGLLLSFGCTAGRAGRPTVQVNCAADSYLGASTLLLRAMRTCEGPFMLGLAAPGTSAPSATTT